MGGRPEFKTEEVQVTVSEEEVPVPRGLSDKEASPAPSLDTFLDSLDPSLDTSLDPSLDTSLAVDPEGIESTKEQTTSDKTGNGGLTVMGAGSAAVGIESGGIGGHCELATATWDQK